MKREEPKDELFLSKRELEIMELISNGFASKQIASVLNISEHTVETHRRNLIKRTGVKNTLELSVILCKKGII